MTETVKVFLDGYQVLSDISSSSAETEVSNFANLSNIRTANAGCAICEYFSVGEFTCRMVDFNIPTNAVITGIKYKIIYNVLAGTYDFTMKIRAGVSGDWVEKTDTGIPRGDLVLCDNDNLQTITYGGQNDLWGTSWTPSDFNTVNRDNVSYKAAADSVYCVIDHVEITVYYTLLVEDLNPTKIEFYLEESNVGGGYMIVPDIVYWYV